MSRRGRGRFSRRDWLALGCIALVALALGHWLRTAQPVGEDVSDRVAVADIARTPGYPSSGPDGADVTLLVFTDYACPVCRETAPDLEAAATADGRTRIVYRDWPIFGESSQRAARVALAADRQGIYPELHRRLMRAPNLGEAELRRAVERSGGDWAKLQSDLDRHGEAIDRLIAGTGRDALRLGYPGTPGYLVGRFRIAGAASEAELRRAIARARAPARPD